MSTTNGASTSVGGRKRGGTRRIDREMIVDVAREMDPRTLTMKAVADELGVDRKALNYHVTDRDGLLRLVATDLFASSFAESFHTYLDATETLRDADWKRVVHAWAIGVRDSMVTTGVISHYFRLQTEDLAVFEPAEAVLQSMLKAGFDLTTAARGLIFVTHFAMGVGRDVIMGQQHGEHPQVGEVRRLLESAQDDDFEAFRGLASLGLNTSDDMDAQFIFEVDVFVSGMEQQLSLDS